MRAVVLKGGDLTVREIDDPVPGRRELLLRTLSTAICASDVHFMDHPELCVDDPTGRSLYDPDRDIVLGHEFVGEVVGHGPDCTDQFAVGTRVTSIPIRLVNGGTDGSASSASTRRRRGSSAPVNPTARRGSSSIRTETPCDRPGRPSGHLRCADPLRHRHRPV